MSAVILPPPFEWKRVVSLVTKIINQTGINDETGRLKAMNKECCSGTFYLNNTKVKSTPANHLSYKNYYIHGKGIV